MSTYIVTKKSDGKIVYEYDNDVKIVWDQFPEFDHDYTEVVGVPGGVVTHSVHGGRRVLTKNEFRKLFTFDERTVMDEFEDTYDSLGLTDAVVRNLRTGYKDYADAQDIDLDDAGVGIMLTVLSQLGKLEKSRIGEVLNG